MAKRKFTAQKLAHMETSNRVIRRVNGGLCIFLAVAFGLLIAATAVPQKRKFEKLAIQLRQTQERENETLARKEYKEVELHALREDNSYLEIQARDRLNYYRPGERVLRFNDNP